MKWYKLTHNTYNDLKFSYVGEDKFTYLAKEEPGIVFFELASYTRLEIHPEASDDIVRELYDIFKRGSDASWCDANPQKDRGRAKVFTRIHRQMVVDGFVI